MNNKAILGLMLAGALGFTVAGISSADAQSTLGGAKPQQNKIGGVAKPPPVVGGATTHASMPPPAPPKPGPVTAMAKSTSPTPGTTGASTPAPQTASTPKPNPPPTTATKNSSIVTASSTPKCASGSCKPKIPRP
jgi:hypothetical protein